MKPITLNGTYTSPDTGLKITTLKPVVFEVSKDKEFFVAKNEELGLHTFSNNINLLETELVEEIAFILKFVKDKPSSKAVVAVFTISG